MCRCAVRHAVRSLVGPQVCTHRPTACAAAPNLLIYMQVALLGAAGSTCAARLLQRAVHAASETASPPLDQTANNPCAKPPQPSTNSGNSSSRFSAAQVAARIVGRASHKNPTAQSLLSKHHGSGAANGCCQPPPSSITSKHQHQRQQQLSQQQAPQQQQQQRRSFDNGSRKPPPSVLQPSHAGGVGSSTAATATRAGRQQQQQGTQQQQHTKPTSKREQQQQQPKLITIWHASAVCAAV